MAGDGGEHRGDQGRDQEAGRLDGTERRPAGTRARGSQLPPPLHRESGRGGIEHGSAGSETATAIPHGL